MGKQRGEAAKILMITPSKEMWLYLLNPQELLSRKNQSFESGRYEFKCQPCPHGKLLNFSKLQIPYLKWIYQNELSLRGVLRMTESLFRKSLAG